MTTNLLTCCERLDESKYWHKCACPSAAFECESDQYDYELCGHSEYEGGGAVPSVPPKKYKVETNRIFDQSYQAWQCCPGPIRKIMRTETVNTEYSQTLTYSLSGVTCLGPALSTTIGIIDQTDTDCNGNETASTRNYSDVCAGGSGTVTFTQVSNVEKNWECSYSKDFFIGSQCAGQLERLRSGSQTQILSSEDTDQDAIDRAELGQPTVGTLCSSRWETRNTQFDWIKRTSGYTIECEDLVIGVEYEVTPTIRKRTAQDGGSGVWEDVTVTPTTFTATAKTETIDDGGNPIDLDSIQGWEYEITGVNIEKKA
jgi:hypothetical protein